MVRYQNFSRLNLSGQPAPLATVTVYISGTGTLANLYVANTLAQPGPNPLTAGLDGYFEFYAPNSRYDIQFSGGGITTPWSLGDILLYDTVDVVSQLGVVQVFPPTALFGPGIVLAPTGVLVSTAGTTTSGLQEALNYAVAHKCDLHVYGGVDPFVGGPCQYHLTTTLTFPPLQGMTIRMDTVTLNFDTPIGANPGIRFDSCELVTFELHGGQVLYQGSGDAVNWTPVNPTPLDQIVGLIGSDFFIHAIATNTPCLTGVRIVPLTSSLPAQQTVCSGCSFIFNEVNGIGNGAVGIRVNNPTQAVGGFVGNRIEADWVHGWTAYAVQEGQTGLAQRLWGNRYRVGAISCDAGISGASGIDICGSFGTWEVGEIDGVGSVGPVENALVLDAGAQGNVIRIGQRSSHQLATIFNGATIQTNRLELREAVQGHFPILVGGSPFVYPTPGDVQIGVSLFQISVLVTGGAVSAIAVSGDGRVTWTPTGMTAGLFVLNAGMFLQVTYTVAPTMLVIRPQFLS